METNYKVKHRRILMPIKLMLLLVAAVLFGLNTYAQPGNAVTVANDQQFLEALGDPSVDIMLFEAGYYTTFEDYVVNGTKAVKAGNAGGSRSFDCVYYIIPSDTCFYPPTTQDTAKAGTLDPFGCLCCPPPDAGTWSVFSQPAGSGPVVFEYALNLETNPFTVDMPGSYELKYSWGAPYNTYVQTEYYFYGPYTLSMSAPDICGLTTTVHLEYTTDFGNPTTTLHFWLNGEPLTTGVPALVPGGDTVDFDLTVPWCGLWEFKVSLADDECGAAEETLWIDFSCDPVADAGPDVEVCEDLCYYSLIGNTGLYQTWSTNYAFSWVQLSGPGTLTFDNNQAETTFVCRDETICSYGEYEIEFQVVNGMCYDSDTMMLTFYEEPVADAGDDQFLCSELCFTLDATPYVYCSAELDDERYYYWQLISTPAGVTLDMWDPNIPNPTVCIVDGDCPYGEFLFEFIEVNGTCETRDTVSVYIFEEPVADAGPDSLTTCFYEGCFTIFGVPYQYCSDMPEGFTRTHEFQLTGWPAGFDPGASSWGEGSAYEFGVCPDGPCIWGEYEVTLYEYNNDPTGNPVCMSMDVINFYLFEPTTADAGDDFSMCYTGGCFSMGAIPYVYCSDPDPNWGDRYGEWAKVAGPAQVEFLDPNNPEATACPDETDDCVYGVYTFEWTEYNGDCEDTDEVMVTLYEPPVADAGDDAWYCQDTDEIGALWHTFAAVPYVYCQEEGLENYSYWSKCGGPGYVTWYENESNPNASVQVSCFGCYCFEYVEVNGDCESRDTVYVCWYEHPYLMGDDLSDSACTTIPVTYDLGNLGIVPHTYTDCENYNVQYWTMISGGGTATFDPDASDPEALVTVDNYGCYSFQFIQYNGVVECADTLQADLWFFEDPIADAGADAEICGPCYMMSAVPYSYVVTDCHPAMDATHFWSFYSYTPPDEYCGFGYNFNPCYTISDIYDPNAEICVCEDDYIGLNYGTYGFIWTEINGECEDQDTVFITFQKEPDEVAITGCVSDAVCTDYICGPLGRELDGCGCATCWLPDDGDVMTVCANTCGYFYIDWACLGQAPIPGYTYEWSFTGPAGSYFDADPYWYDCSCDEWMGSTWVDLCFGECCDTARLYLTITSIEGCVTTEEWKFYVQHPPDATVTGPEIAEVSSIFEYSIPDPANPCYLYIWEVQHCGEIVYGQGTGTIGVHWTDYNENGGWGIVAVEVYDTCTLCCSMDELMVRVLPQGSLGDSTLSGHVYYENSWMTPLNGVQLTLWNAGVPIFETYSFNDIEGGNGVGYYEFSGINETTVFDLSAEYGAPWYGANATDALKIELEAVDPFTITYMTTDVQVEAADVNASGTINATDALWVKQRAISMVSHFPAGDWAFADMSSPAGTYDVMTLNYGDVNSSNIPNSNKEMPAVTFVTDGTINVVPGEVFDMPIRVADAISLGAITMNLGYNSNLLEVVEVMTVDGALTSMTSTNIAMVWSEVNPMVLENNDAIVTLRLKALGEITNNDQLFTIELGTEFADPNALVLEDLTLKTFGISTDPAVADYFLSYNRPNPFSTSTQIEYALPENGKVRLSVVDLLGQDIAVLINQSQSAGSYTVQFNAAGLTPGVYIYKITVEGESRDFVETRRMVISH